MFLYEITQAFEQAKLKYALVGGFAMALHGVVRATMDVDLVLNLSLNDFKLAEKILHQLGLQSRLPIRAQDVIQMRQEYISERNLIAWSFVDYSDPTRLVDILITENLSELKCRKITIQGHKVMVAELEELIRMKQLANRPQDRIDIQNMEAKLHEKITSAQAVKFLEDMRMMAAGVDEATIPISIRIPQNILRSIKLKAKSEGKKYQSLIIEYLRQGLYPRQKS